MAFPKVPSKLWSLYEQVTGIKIEYKTGFDPTAIQWKNYGFAIKATDSTKGEVEAIVSVFGNKDFGGEIVRPGAFDESLKRKLPKVVYMHDWFTPIGKVVEAEELMPKDERLPENIREFGGLYVKMALDMDAQDARETFSKITKGILDEYSIGYMVVEDRYDRDTGTRELLKVDLFEVSPVLLGMNPLTSTVSAKQQASNPVQTIYPNCHTGKLHSPDVIDRNSLRLESRECDGKSFVVMQAVPKGLTTYTDYHYYYPGSTWSEEEAREHTKSIKDTAEFEPSKEKGLTFTDEVDTVHAAVTALSTRAKNLSDLRAKDGRVLSASNREKLANLKQSLADVVGLLDNLLSETDPDKNKSRSAKIRADMAILHAATILLDD
jgi:HK97 family phage prohead protease